MYFVLEQGDNIHLPNAVLWIPILHTACFVSALPSTVLPVTPRQHLDLDLGKSLKQWLFPGSSMSEATLCQAKIGIQTSGSELCHHGLTARPNPPYSLVQVSSTPPGKRVKTGSTGLWTYRFSETGGEVGFGGTQDVLLSLRGRLFSFSWKAIVVSWNRARFPGGCTGRDVRDFGIPLKLTKSH